MRISVCFQASLDLFSSVGARSHTGAAYSISCGAVQWIYIVGKEFAGRHVGEKRKRYNRPKISLLWCITKDTNVETCTHKASHRTHRVYTIRLKNLASLNFSGVFHVWKAKYDIVVTTKRSRLYARDSEINIFNCKAIHWWNCHTKKR